MFGPVSRQLWLMTILLLGLTLFATTLCAMRLPLANLWSTGDEVLRHIWLTIRLPRVLLALLVGSALALSGCVMQGLFRNPLADPGLLGISSGAALAVALWVQSRRPAALTYSIAVGWALIGIVAVNWSAEYRHVALLTALGIAALAALYLSRGWRARGR